MGWPFDECPGAPARRVRRRVLACLVLLVVLAATADARPRPSVEIRGVRGSELVAWDAADSVLRVLARAPFPFVHGVAWTCDGGRWLVWGGGRALPTEEELFGRPRPIQQTLTLGDETGRAVTVPLRGLGADRVVDARWDGSGRQVLVLGLPAMPGMADTRSTCAILAPDGRIIARAEVNGSVASCAGSPDGTSWLVAGRTSAGPLLFLWTPPAAPEPVAPELPVPRPGLRIAEIAEVRWHPTDPRRFAAACRLSPGDSTWAVAVASLDGAAGESIGDLKGVRALAWSADGARLAWVGPKDRAYRYREHALPTLRYDALVAARPGYAPEAVFDILDHRRVRRPEELTALALWPAVESYASCEGGICVVTAATGPSLLPAREIWWVPSRGEPMLLAGDLGIRGPISVDPR